MANLKHIVDYLDRYLRLEDFKDSSWNGLQFQGKEDIKKIIFAVDTGIDTFKEAARQDADMIIVHHGQFWEGTDPRIINAAKKRLEILFDNNISLYAAHLPLDRHKIVGNNAQLLKILEANIEKDFAEYKGQMISWQGSLKKRRTLLSIARTLEKELSAECLILPFGKKSIKKIAVCSGGTGIPELMQAIDACADLYITGERSELYHIAKDNGINVIFAGHHATETLGVKALAQILKKKFSDTECIFIDIPTGL